MIHFKIHKTVLLLLACYFFQTACSYAQLLRKKDFELNNIILKYQQDYEAVLKKNKIKKATSASAQYGNSTMYEYDRNGRVTKTNYQADAHNNGTRKYDSLGRLTERTEIQFAPKPDTAMIFRFEYDAKNSIVKKTIWYKKKNEYPTGDLMKPIRYTNKLEVYAYENYYDDNNRLVKQVEKSADTVFCTVMYRYDERGNLVEWKILKAENFTDRHYTLVYDQQNRVTEIHDLSLGSDQVQHIFYNEKGQVVNEFKKIAYLPNGLIKSITQHSENEGTSIVDEFKYEYYQ